MKKIDYKNTTLFGIVVLIAFIEAFAGIIGFLTFASDDETEIALIFIGSAIVAIIALIGYFSIAFHFYMAAVDKGYESEYYLNLAFFFPFAGYSLVVALPDRKNKAAVNSKVVVDEELPEL